MSRYILHKSQPRADEPGKTIVFDRLRTDLARADLKDAVLGKCLAEALEELDIDATVADVLYGRMPDGLRERVLSSLCLPPRAAPLMMPVQVLEHERAGGLGRVMRRMKTQALRGTAWFGAM